MDEYDSRSPDKSQKHGSHCGSDGKIQYLLIAEERILHSISTRAPLPEVLNSICGALDSEMGNMASLISLPGDEAADLAIIASSAALFGLRIFCSVNVVAEDGEVLGSLEMYCCAPRSPSGREFQLIERATCLAAIAIERHRQAGNHGTCCLHENRPVQGCVLEWPVSAN